MKSRKVKAKTKKRVIMMRDHVAQNMNKVNRCEAHTDKKNDYQRTPKHKGSDICLDD